MTETMHYKAPAMELLQSTSLHFPQEKSAKLFSADPLKDDTMQTLMKPVSPTADPEAPKFSLKNLPYVMQTIYRILAKSLCPIKGYNSDSDEVVGIMKNVLFSICHYVPFDTYDFFIRNLANVAQTPFELNPYAP